MAAPTQTETLLTGEDLLALGDIGPCELVEGRLVTMIPTAELHGGYENNIAFHVTRFVREHKLGHVRVGEVGIYTRRNPDTVRGADVIFISNERYAKRNQRGGYLEVAPELIVEILSPADRWVEVTQKLREYFAIGVVVMLVIDPARRVAYAYRSLSQMREFTEADALVLEDILPGFAVPMAELFAD